MRRFSAGYLDRTRAGMWEDSTDALAGLELPTREHIVDVGCGTGELTTVLATESDARVVACDVDATLLAHVTDAERLLGSADLLPLRADAADLVVCQALLINVPEPDSVVSEFARVSSDLVAAIEPDNAAVTVESTIDAEAALERRARRAYLEGVETDVTLGANAAELFERAGLTVVDSTRYDHDRTIEAPYDEAAVVDARRKATGAGLDDDAPTMLRGELSQLGYDELRSEWREMGRAVVDAMAEGTYQRREVVPFHVTVGRVPP